MNRFSVNGVVSVASAIFVLSLIGCGGGDKTPQASPAASSPPAAPASQPAATAKKPTTKPKTRPAVKKPAPVAKPAPVDETLTAYVMLEAPKYELEEAAGLNQYLVGTGPVDANAFAMSVPTTRTTRSTVAPRVPDGLTAVAEAGVADDGFALQAISDTDGALMVYVPAGQYRQGNGRGATEEQPEHTAFVSAFYIDVYEVTVEKYMTFFETTRNTRERVNEPSNQDADGQIPAVGLGFRDAAAYAKWAGKELPTETQWEKAARGGQSLPFVWGRGRPLWYAPREPGQLSPVGSYPSDRSVYGVIDLAGNAREWCRDFWDANSYEEAAREPGGVARDWDGPRRPSQRNLRVVRGDADGWSTTTREGVSSAAKDKSIGFRCVLAFDPDEVAAPRRRSNDDD